ncbi:hypothetical protein EBB07_19575 [Paenibacillaceae bacterium]|nr:hypothetical protein EBB07_19575 [Paenibacillaceae bacterium]
MTAPYLKLTVRNIALVAIYGLFLWFKTKISACYCEKGQRWVAGRLEKRNGRFSKLDLHLLKISMRNLALNGEWKQPANRQQHSGVSSSTDF